MPRFNTILSVTCRSYIGRYTHITTQQRGVSFHRGFGSVPAPCPRDLGPLSPMMVSSSDRAQPEAVVSFCTLGYALMYVQEISMGGDVLDAIGSGHRRNCLAVHRSPKVV